MNGVFVALRGNAAASKEPQSEIHITFNAPKLGVRQRKYEF